MMYVEDYLCMRNTIQFEISPRSELGKCIALLGVERYRGSQHSNVFFLIFR